MKKRISIFLVVLWMILIFVMSSFDAADSSNQSGVIVNFIANIFNISNTDLLGVVIRKLAHLMEYFILGLFVYNLVYNYNKKSYLTIIFCILYAFSDEIHQIFVPGREFKLFDILIDSIGSVLGIIVCKYLIVIVNKYLKSKEIK